MSRLESDYSDAMALGDVNVNKARLLGPTGKRVKDDDSKVWPPAMARPAGVATACCCCCIPALVNAAQWHAVRCRPQSRSCCAPARGTLTLVCVLVCSLQFADAAGSKKNRAAFEDITNHGKARPTAADKVRSPRTPDRACRATNASQPSPGSSLGCAAVTDLHVSRLDAPRGQEAAGGSPQHACTLHAPPRIA